MRNCCPPVPAAPRLIVTIVVALCAITAVSCTEDDPIASWLEVPPDYLKCWGTYGLEDGNFHSPSGIAADREGNILVLDTNYRRVQKFTPDGDFLAKWTVTVGHDETRLWYPFGLAVSATGEVYVQSDLHGVLRFSSEGEYLQTYACESGRFGLAADTTGAVYVLETPTDTLTALEIRYLPRILKIDASGVVTDTLELPSFVENLSSETGTPGRFFESLVVDREGNFYVGGTEMRFHLGRKEPVAEIIWKLDPQGQVLQRPLYYRGDPDYGLRVNFEGMGVDSEGFLYVADRVKELVRKIDQAGRVVTQWDQGAAEYDDLDDPVGLCVDARRQIYVTEWQHRRVVKYGYPD